LPHLVLKRFFLKHIKIIISIILFSFISFGCKDRADERSVMPTVFVEKVDGDFRLVRNGQPYYIKGGAAHPDYLKELKEAGANTARIYDTINLKKILDEAHTLGLAVVADIPMPKLHTDGAFYEEDHLFNELKRRVSRVVNDHKDHPALLYWNLGNELYYPYFYKNTNLHDRFNILIDLIHEIDKNHPVSTVTIGANKLRILSIHRKSPQLDFISFNSFGVLSQFSKKLKPISPIWKGPYVITEWGVNGPWEAQLTSWNAPIEETSTKKAEQIKQRYYDYMEPLKEENAFGSFVFYWGHKNEITPTWYSMFTKDKLKTQGVFEMENIWNNDKTRSFPGPQLEYILMNDKGAADNIILAPEQMARVDVILPQNKSQNLEYHWEIRKESWNAYNISETVKTEDFQNKGNSTYFKAPMDEGPYRVFLYLTNDSEYIATANIPFYVLNPRNEE